MKNNIWAVGRNYASHAKELGNEIPKEPLIFLKAGTCATEGEKIIFPPWLEEAHHEIEIILRFSDLEREFCFDAVSIALDLTDRKKQNELKAKGNPWTLAKSFKNSCPLSLWQPITSFDEFEQLSLRLTVNGESRQSGTTQQMLFNLRTLSQYVLKYFPVAPGDFLLTGTPEGVGPLKRSDRLTGSLLRGTTSLINQTWTVI